MFIVVINEEESPRLTFSQNTSQGELYFTIWLAPRSVRMKQVLSQAGEMTPPQEWGSLTASMEREFPKFEE